jgi:pimeloyl-ACP methyl ester carboxylesterase
MAVYVLVHGGDRDGSIWREIAYLLIKQGHRVFCPSMSSVKEASLQQNIEEVSSVIKTHDLKNIILVGHSYGAMVITGVADSLFDRIAYMVYVDSVVPENDKSLYGLLADYGISYKAYNLTPDPACLDEITFDSRKLAKLSKAYVLCLQSEFVQVTRMMYERVMARADTDRWLCFCLDTTHACMLKQPRQLAAILAGLILFIQ